MSLELLVNTFLFFPQKWDKSQQQIKGMKEEVNDLKTKLKKAEKSQSDIEKDFAKVSKEEMLIY